MSKGKRLRGARQSLAPPGPRLNRVLWIAGGAAVLALVSALFVVFGLPSATATKPAVVPAQVDEVGAERLVGRWLRPDGGYILDIRGALPDGRLDAAYLNPRSINVSRAEWQREGRHLRVFIELRDVNYPGSTYTLRYVPDQDRLVGAYYQAAQRQSFDVEFVRQK
jgi:hypothetical protein